MRVLRRRVIGLAVVALLGLAATAAVADGLYGPRGSGPASYGMPSIWQGLYGGVHLGHVDAGNDDGFVGGVQVGYN